MQPPNVPDSVLKAIRSSRQGDVELCRLSKASSNRDGRHVLKFKKSIYGLRQAEKQWHLKLKLVIFPWRLEQGTADPCLFFMDMTMLVGNSCTYTSTVLMWRRRRCKGSTLSSGNYDLSLT